MNTGLIIFILTYIIIGIQNIPKIHINRTAGALLGAVGMVFFGVLTVNEAYQAIDLDIILFVLGMMIIIAYMELSGFFEVIERMILKRAGSASGLLFFLIISSGVASSLFMNDTICLLFTPLVLRIVKKANLNPIPYLIGLATSSNIGSTMTVIGNPQNMLIGLYSKIHFLEFLKILAPVSISGLIINFLLIRIIYHKDIANRFINVNFDDSGVRIQKRLFIASLITIILLVIFLSLGYSPQNVAIVLACFLILVGADKPRRALEEVDWPLLLFFSGLFIVMKGVEKSGITNSIFNYVRMYLSDSKFSQIVNLSIGSTILSNIISNVPAVILFSHFFTNLANSKLAWLTLAMSSTLAGNLTIIGSVANIIVFESAKDEVKVGFFEYLKVGLPLTIITILIGIVILYILA
uniref:Anion transporter n=1 Tax=candidate division WOR-3 bacterium TaxID=2052148 RepID=A0A7V3RHZ7_UNCW3